MFLGRKCSSLTAAKRSSASLLRQCTSFRLADSFGSSRFGSMISSFGSCRGSLTLLVGAVFGLSTCPPSERSLSPSTLQPPRKRRSQTAAQPLLMPVTRGAVMRRSGSNVRSSFEFPEFHRLGLVCEYHGFDQSSW